MLNICLSALLLSMDSPRRVGSWPGSERGSPKGAGCGRVPTSQLPSEHCPCPQGNPASPRALGHDVPRSKGIMEASVRGRCLGSWEPPRSHILGRGTGMTCHSCGRGVTPEGRGITSCHATEGPLFSSERERRFPTTHSLEEASFKTQNF